VRPGAQCLRDLHGRDHGGKTAARVGGPAARTGRRLRLRLRTRAARFLVAIPHACARAARWRAACSGRASLVRARRHWRLCRRSLAPSGHHGRLLRQRVPARRSRLRRHAHSKGAVCRDGLSRSSGRGGSGSGGSSGDSGGRRVGGSPTNGSKGGAGHRIGGGRHCRSGGSRHPLRNVRLVSERQLQPRDACWGGCGSGGSSGSSGSGGSSGSRFDGGCALVTRAGTALALLGLLPRRRGHALVRRGRVGVARHRCRAGRSSHAAGSSCTSPERSCAPRCARASARACARDGGRHRLCSN